ncbi:MAG: nucleotidyltransferase domain-containing protein [Bacteroidales bacterium]|nr:nucleotidyltransferase domain-containing protein [Bacteroidales bacterium]
MNKLLSENINKIIEYCEKYKVEELYAIGSVTTEYFTDESDVDLLIKFSNITIEEYTDNYFILHKLFEKTFNRKIDLITYKSLSNPYFIKSINENKQLLYAV